VFAIRAFDALLAEGFDEAFAVVRKDVDLAEGFLYDPEAMFRVIGADADAMRAGAFFAGAFADGGIPLEVFLLQLAVGIEGVEAMAEDAQFGGAEDVDVVDRASEAEIAGGERIGELRFTALQDEDPVGRFGPHTGTAAEGVAGISEGFVPAADDVVGAGADGARDDGRLTLRLGKRRRKQK
jgi:hypothetical protein